MILRQAWPLPVTIAVTVILLALCVAGWYAGRRSNRHATADWIRRSLMVLCVTALGLTPSTPRESVEQVSNAEIYFFVDETGSMMANDYTGGEPRITGVKADINAIIDEFPGARYSVVVFGATATQDVPLTTDARAIRSWTDAYSTEWTMYSHGSSINRPVEVAHDLLSRSAEERPQNIRLVFVLTDGESTQAAHSNRDDPVEWQSIAPYVDGGAVLGYGTEEGGTMTAQMYDNTTELIRDPDTLEPAISRINLNNLNVMGDQLSIPVIVSKSTADVANVADGIDIEEIAELSDRQPDAYNDVLWPIGIALAVLAVWEALRLAPKLRAIRRAGARTLSGGSHA